MDITNDEAKSFLPLFEKGRAPENEKLTLFVREITACCGEKDTWFVFDSRPGRIINVSIICWIEHQQLVDLVQKKRKEES